MLLEFFGNRDCSRFSFFFFFCLQLPSTNPEKEEVNSHSCFLLRAKKSTSLFSRARFPSLLGSSEYIVRLCGDLGWNTFQSSPACPYLLSCQIRHLPAQLSPGPGLCSHDERVCGGCVCCKLGHTGKLQGVSEFTCPAFQAHVFDIEQWNDSARFSSVRLECS